MHSSSERMSAIVERNPVDACATDVAYSRGVVGLEAGLYELLITEGLRARDQSLTSVAHTPCRRWTAMKSGMS